MGRGSRHELIMPDLGIDRPMVASLWLIERGSRLTEGDQLLEILAGEAVVDLAAPATGRLVETLVAEGATIQPGQRLAVIEQTDRP